MLRRKFVKLKELTVRYFLKKSSVMSFLSFFCVLFMLIAFFLYRQGNPVKRHGRNWANNRRMHLRISNSTNFIQFLLLTLPMCPVWRWISPFWISLDKPYVSFSILFPCPREKSRDNILQSFLFIGSSPFASICSTGHNILVVWCCIFFSPCFLYLKRMNVKDLSLHLNSWRNNLHTRHCVLFFCIIKHLKSMITCCSCKMM